MTFKEAFRKARAAGKKTFTWNGKSYTTQTAEEAAAVKNAPSRPSTRPRARPSPSSSPRPRANPRSARAAEDKKGDTGNVNSARAQRTRMERRIGEQSLLNVPRNIGVGIARMISDRRIAAEDARKTRARPCQ